MIALFAAEPSAQFLTPEVIGILATVAGVFARHYIPWLKKVLPARPGDPQPTAPVTPAPPATPAAPVTPVLDKPLADAFHWLSQAAHGLTPVDEADLRTIRAIKPLVDALVAAPIS